MNNAGKTVLTALILSFSAAAFAETPPPPPRQQRPPLHFLRNLPETEQQKLQELYRKDPAAFHEELKSRLEKEHAEQRKEALAMRNRYLNAAAPEDAAAVKKELREKLSKKFDEQLKHAEQRIAENESRLRNMQKRNERFRQEVNRRKENKEAWIEKILNDLLNPDKEPDFSRPPKKKPKK